MKIMNKHNNKQFKIINKFDFIYKIYIYVIIIKIYVYK